MILTGSDLAALKSSLAFWEIVEYVSAATVLIGVIGEYIAEFTSFAAKRSVEKSLAKLSTLVLIIGLAVELLSLVKTSQLSGRLIASLEEQTAQANARAAEASAHAVEAQFALEKFKAPRTLSFEQQAKIIGEMKQFSGTPFVLGVFQEPEALALLTQIEDILIKAGWVEEEWKSGGDVVYSRQGRPNIGYTFVTGLYVQADYSHAADFRPIVMLLASLLSDAGIDAKPEVGRMAPNTNNDAIKILIGQKPR
jgi:hypothetical protein